MAVFLGNTISPLSANPSGFILYDGLVVSIELLFGVVCTICRQFVGLLHWSKIHFATSNDKIICIYLTFMPISRFFIVVNWQIIVCEVTLSNILAKKYIIDISGTDKVKSTFI